MALAWMPIQADDAASQTPPVNSSPFAPPPLAKLADADQLAARMKTGQDLYRQIREQAIATYARLHPAASSGDDDAKRTIRLAAYLFVWGDFYREGLWDGTVDHATAAASSGLVDPLLQALPIIHALDAKQVTSEHQALFFSNEGDQLAASDYPDCFKFWFDALETQNLVSLKMRGELRDPQTQALLPAVVEKAAGEYGELIKAKIDHGVLAAIGETFFHGLQGDETSLTSAADTIDQAFASSDPSNALRDVIQARYDIALAWTARGTGNANVVTPDGWKLFADRLKKAADILEAAYLQHPEEGAISRLMLTVELGQGQGRDRMELWFGRAIKANPDDFQAYSAKAYYLTPEWYGSDDDVWTFGVECAKTQNWPAKIPMVLVDSMVSHLWKKHPEYLTDAGKWAVLDAAFRGYLDHYPASNYYRSIYARWATEGAHWNVAQEQFKILGDHWDRVVFPGSRYPEMKGLSDKNSP